MRTIIMSRVVVQKKTKTIERYNVASRRACAPQVLILHLSSYRCCPSVQPICPPITANTVLDGGAPNTTSACIFDGGAPNDQGGTLIDGGVLNLGVCDPIVGNQVLDGSRTDTFCIVDGGNPAAAGGTVFSGGSP